MQNKQINEVKGESYLASAWREFRKNRSAVLGIVVLALIVILAVGADMIAPYLAAIFLRGSSMEPESLCW